MTHFGESSIKHHNILVGQRQSAVLVALVSFGFFYIAYVGSRKLVVLLTVMTLLESPLHNVTIVVWLDHLWVADSRQFCNVYPFTVGV